jgi:hypothetical protein
VIANYKLAIIFETSHKQVPPQTFSVYLYINDLGYIKV